MVIMKQNKTNKQASASSIGLKIRSCAVAQRLEQTSEHISWLMWEFFACSTD